MVGYFFFGFYPKIVLNVAEFFLEQLAVRTVRVSPA
jgi:hypothetical protein